MSNTPDYDPNLSPERNAEIKEWAAKNRTAMAVGRKMPDNGVRFNFNEQDFDDDDATNKIEL
jgi:hypothetical protein